MSDTPETDAKVSGHIGFYSCATVPAELCRRMERERDEARKHLREIKEYGTEEINAAVELRQKLAQALFERDEAREAMREAWFAMDETDGTERMIEWQNKNANILEGAK